MPSTTTPGEVAGGPRTGGPRTYAARPEGPQPEGAGPRRRSVLAGAAGLLAAGGAASGCTDDGESPAARRRRIDAAKRLRRDAARESETLLARYTGTTAAHPALAGRLKAMREATARHVEAFGGTAPRPGEEEPRRGGRPSEQGQEEQQPRDAPGDGPAAANRMAVPGDEARALAVLADAERRTADARLRALVDAPPELARLLASVAAAGSTHAFLLTQGPA